jgi:hypothetical protein
MEVFQPMLRRGSQMGVALVYMASETDGQAQRFQSAGGKLDVAVGKSTWSGHTAKGSRERQDADLIACG